MTNRETTDDRRLARYLLGQLTQDEQARVEEQYLADPDIHEELRAAERELIDQYVSGDLADRTAFEAHFLTSPGRRERVAFARALRQALSRSPADTRAPERESWLVAARRFLGTSSRTWQLAAAMFVVIAAGWLLDSIGRQPPAIEIARRPTVPPPGAAPAPAPPANPPPATASPAVAPPASPPQVTIATLVLLPNSTRGSEATPTLLIRGAAEVRLDLHLETGDYKSYRATIRTAEGEEVWRVDRLRLEATPAGRAIVVRLPARRFDRGDYIAMLRGVTAAGEVDEVGSYYFRVQAR